MNIDPKDYQKALEKQKGDQKPNNARTFLRQAAVSAQQLTGDPHWDKFLSYIQSELDGISGQLKIATEALNDRITVNHEELILLKMSILEYRTAKQVLENVMNYPKKIIAEDEHLDTV